MNTTWAKLIAEFKANPRLRVGVWFCLAVFWCYAILGFQEIVTAKSKEYQALTKRIARTQAVADQKNWQLRVDEAQAIEKSLTGRLWKERTQGLAQAAFQDWLVQSLQQLSIAKPQIVVVAQDGPKQQGVAEGDVAWKVSASVAFDFNPKTFNDLVEKLASNEKGDVILENLSIRSAPSPRADMILVAYFAKQVDGIR